jgi:hypothetical protein
MLNGTQVEMALKASSNPDEQFEKDVLPHNFPIPNQSVYHLVSAKLGLVPDWIRSFSNVAFYWLECFLQQQIMAAHTLAPGTVEVDQSLWRGCS